MVVLIYTISYICSVITMIFFIAGVAALSSVVFGYFFVYRSSVGERRASSVHWSNPSHEVNSGGGRGWMDSLELTLQDSVVAVWDVLCDKIKYSFTLAEKVVKLASFSFKEGSEFVSATAPEIAKAVDQATTAATSVANGAAKGTLDAASNATSAVKDVVASMLSSGQGGGQGLGDGEGSVSVWSWIPKWW